MTQQRLDRLMHWSSLCLLRLAPWIVQNGWISGPLERALEQALKPKLADLARGIGTVIALKAVLATPRKIHKAGGKPFKQRKHIRRAAIGARLRKLVRARDLRARIATLLMLLRNAEREVARITRRLRRGLTRHVGGVLASSFEISALEDALIASAQYPNTS